MGASLKGIELLFFLAINCLKKVNGHQKAGATNGLPYRA